jgi:hypothetical protein
MLSGAKHLLFFEETSKSRSFAAAQDDRVGGAGLKAAATKNASSALFTQTLQG